MKILRKNIALAKILIVLFMVPLFAPVGMATNLHEPAGVGTNGTNGIVICTTTGLKLLTPTGEIVPMGDHDQSLSSEHCEACFLSGLAGNTARNAANIITLARIVKSKTRLMSFELASPVWTNTCLGARAPPV